MPLADAVKESPTHSLHIDICPLLISPADVWSFLLQEVNIQVSYQILRSDIWCFYLSPWFCLPCRPQVMGVWSYAPVISKVAELRLGSALHHTPFLRLGLSGLAVPPRLFCPSLLTPLIREDFELKSERSLLQVSVGGDLSSVWPSIFFQSTQNRTSGCFQGQTLSWPVARSLPDLAAVQVVRISFGWIVLKQHLQSIKQKKKKRLFFDGSFDSGFFISAHFCP